MKQAKIKNIMQIVIAMKENNTSNKISKETKRQIINTAVKTVSARSVIRKWRSYKSEYSKHSLS
jgi:hypothetical protein